MSELSPAVGQALLVIAGHVQHPHPRDVLEQALIEMSSWEETLALKTPPGELVGLRQLLSMELARRILADESANIDDGIRLLRRLLPLRESAPRTWAMAQHNIGVAETRRYGPDRPAALKRAATAFTCALEVWTPDTDPDDWANATVALGQLLIERVLPGDHTAHADEGLRLLREAHARVPAGVRPVTRLRLTAALATAVARPGSHIDLATLDDAIGLCTEACRLADSVEGPDPLRADVRMNLGRFQAQRAELTGEGWAEARGHLEAALAAIDPSTEPLRWARAAGNVANALRSAPDARDEDVQRAVALHRDASRLQYAHQAPWDAAANQNNLGNALGQLTSGDPVEKADQAIGAYLAARQTWTPSSHPHEWALTTARLAGAYVRRAQLGAPQYLEAALREFSAALSAIDPGRDPLDWARVANSMGTAYQSVADTDTKAAEPSLLEAIRLFEAASHLLGRIAAPHDWASFRNNLGQAWLRLAALRDDPSALQAAVAAYQEALDARPRESAPYEWAQTTTGLAGALADAGQFQQAAKLLQTALHLARDAGWPSLIQATAWRLAHLEARQNHWPQAAAAAEEALRAAEEHYDESVLRQSRESVLTGIAGRATFTAYAHARAGNVVKAAKAVERGRARLLSDALALHSAADLAAAREVQAAEAAAIKLAQTPIDPAAQTETYRRRAEQAARDRLREARKRLDALASAADQSTETASLNRPVVYVLVTAFGGLALVHRPDGSTIDLSAADVQGVEQAARQVLQVQKTWGSRERRHLSSALNTALPAIGRSLCGQIADELRKTGDSAVALVPCGVIGALPIHAAPYTVEGELRCLADEFVVSYVPSRSVFASATQRLAARAAPLSLLAVTDPTGDLPFASVEVNQLAGRLASRMTELPGPAATRDRVAAAMRQATHVHFACHGRTHAGTPLASHLALANDGRLTLADLLGAQQDDLAAARLVVASACQTAVIDGTRVPDEVVGLAAGFLQAGVPGFVGTLWPVGDLASALLMTRFYELLFPPDNEPPHAPDAALTAAAKWLRDVDKTTVTSFLDTHPHLAKRLGVTATYLRRNPNPHPFQLSYHSWASHVFVGAAAAEHLPAGSSHS
ncbi:CHAT domain-containing protein [Streptomyces sp. NPDC059862]|uniref:CHAT domain-containing protein n=1 Tax=Streptomyces sp. NPDC059862 TaxID=3346975 RepID=UPI003658D039